MQNARLDVMAITDVLFIYDPFETYRSFRWMNNQALTEKIFWALLTTHIIIILQKKIFKNNYILNELLYKRAQPTGAVKYTDCISAEE